MALAITSTDLAQNFSYLPNLSQNREPKESFRTIYSGSGKVFSLAHKPRLSQIVCPYSLSENLRDIWDSVTTVAAMPPWVTVVKPPPAFTQLLDFLPVNVLAGDLDRDGDVDRHDALLLVKRLYRAVIGTDDPYDLNHDGRITITGLRQLIQQCTRSACAVR